MAGSRILRGSSHSDLQAGYSVLKGSDLQAGSPVLRGSSHSDLQSIGSDLQAGSPVLKGVSCL